MVFVHSTGIFVRPYCAILDSVRSYWRMGAGRIVVCPVCTPREPDSGRWLIVSDEFRYLADTRYLFNPYTLMTCLSRSTTSIDGTILLGAISLAANGELESRWNC